MYVLFPDDMSSNPALMLRGSHTSLNSEVSDAFFWLPKAPSYTWCTYKERNIKINTLMANIRNTEFSKTLYIRGIWDSFTILL